MFYKRGYLSYIEFVKQTLKLHLHLRYVVSQNANDRSPNNNDYLKDNNKEPR